MDTRYEMPCAATLAVALEVASFQFQLVEPEVASPSRASLPPRLSLPARLPPCAACAAWLAASAAVVPGRRVWDLEEFWALAGEKFSQQGAVTSASADPFPAVSTWKKMLVVRWVSPGGFV